MKKIDLNENELKNKTLEELVKGLSIPFLTIEINVNPIGYGTSIGANKIGGEYLKERYNISKEQLAELVDKYVEPAIDKFIDEVKNLEKRK